jgi:hypothetical protein
LRSFGYAVFVAALLQAGLGPALGQTLIVGNDEKQGVDANFKPVLREPGHDTLSVLDISRPDAPHIERSLQQRDHTSGFVLLVHQRHCRERGANGYEPR